MIRVSKFRRTNGVWYVRYSLDGQRSAESAMTKSESVAESYRLKREMEINAGIQPMRHGDVADLISRYLEAMPPGTSAAHRGEAERILNGFLRICGRKRANGFHGLKTGQLSPETIDRFITRRQRVQLHDGTKRSKLGRKVLRYKPVSNVTLRKELRYLSGFLNWCCRQRPPYLRENPILLSNAASVKDDAKPHFMITDDGLRVILRACENVRQYLFVLLGWWTGGRRSDILALHYYHFDFDAGTVTITHAKNRMYGILPMSPQILELVQQLYREANEADPLFPEDPLPSHAFARLCRKAGVRHHRFHDLRISTSMKIKSGGFDAGLAGLWVGNQGATNRTYYSDLTAVAKQIGSLLRVESLPPVPSRTA